MKAFHSDDAVKAKYLTRVEGHIAADNLIRGEGWDGKKGCAVGCTLHAYNHSLYPIELGIPEWLARVEDRLFEGMSEAKSRTWPYDFLSAITPGVDLERVKGPFLIMVLKSALLSFDNERFPDVTKAVRKSIALWGREDIGSPAWIAEADAAAEAARAAAEAEAWAAAEASRAAEAWAAEAARAAAEASRAARAVAEAASRAAEVRAEAWAVAYDNFADELITILAELKP